MWVPKPGDLVGLKSLNYQGIVVESRESAMAQRLFGVRSGTALVLVDGQQQSYGWTDIYPIEPDEDDDDGPEAA